ncbi:MAG: hypothetical protein ACE5JU_16685, partial [Candidatus Binatia bacterium]
AEEGREEPHLHRRRARRSRHRLARSPIPSATPHPRAAGAIAPIYPQADSTRMTNHALGILK